MVILSIAYLPSVEYLLAFLKANDVCIERHENFIKQTYRNRCVIPTANGLLNLSIPVTKNKLHNCPINQVQIDYQQSWQRTHWRAIETAYNTSPFFLYYRDYFEVFYTQQNTGSLFEYDLQLFNLILQLFGIRKQYVLTSKYVAVYGNEIIDLRQTIHPKKKKEDSGGKNSFVSAPYRQVFSDRLGFIPNTSCIDLLFNEGKFAKDYLLQEIEREDFNYGIYSGI
jgi:hypothetical protein